MNDKGKRAFAVAPIADFERLVDAADIRDIEATAGDEVFPQEFVEKLLVAKNPLAVWREYRGMTQ